jgi:hypothetical protein
VRDKILVSRAGAFLGTTFDCLSLTVCGLTKRWSARVKDRVPSSHTAVRGAQLNG